MRLSRIFRPEDGQPLEDSVPVRRTLFWVLVWMAIVFGLVLYFEYARHVVPLLD